MKNIISLLILSLSFAVSVKCQQTVGVFFNDSLSLNGYTLISPLNSTESYLIDNCGFVINEWSKSEFVPGGSTYLLEDGSLIRTCRVDDGEFQTGGSGGRLERYDWDGNLIWEYNFYSDKEQQHHDIEVLPNGNILILSFDLKTKEEAIAAGRDPSTTPDELWSEKIVEISPVGNDQANVVWEWYLWDHIVQDFDADLDNFGQVMASPELIDINYSEAAMQGKDWVHMNSIDYNPELDQIVLSVRNYNELWIIDHSTTTAEAATHTGGKTNKGGDILYRWGNPQAYKHEGEKIFYGQHDVNWITAGYRDAGKIMVYNNGLEFPDEVSRVQIIETPINIETRLYSYIPNMAYGPEAVFWSYNTPLYSDFVSGANRLPNGNTLICDGPLGSIIELDETDRVVWKYVSPAGLNSAIASQGDYPSGNSLFRATKYGEDFPAFENRDLVPEEPLEINPTIDDCTIFFDSTTSSSYRPPLPLINARVITNPIFDHLEIENNTGKEIEIRGYDIYGKEILKDYSSLYIKKYDVDSWNSGYYIIYLSSTDNSSFYTKKIFKF